MAKIVTGDFQVVFACIISQLLLNAANEKGPLTEWPFLIQKNLFHFVGQPNPKIIQKIIKAVVADADHAILLCPRHTDTTSISAGDLKYSACHPKPPFHHVATLSQYSLLISMFHDENPYEAVVAGSFLKTLKAEELYFWEYRTIEYVQIQLPFFIQEVHKIKRLYSYLGFRPPLEFEELFKKNQSPDRLRYPNPSNTRWSVYNRPASRCLFLPTTLIYFVSFEPFNALAFSIVSPEVQPSTESCRRCPKI